MGLWQELGGRWCLQTAPAVASVPVGFPFSSADKVWMWFLGIVGMCEEGLPQQQQQQDKL